MPPFFNRAQRNAIAAAMRLARPVILDSAQDKAENQAAWLWARDTYTNACEQLAEMFEREGEGIPFSAEDKQIFLSNCRALTLKPFTCTKCGQHITDGKPCGHGRRIELGIV